MKKENATLQEKEVCKELTTRQKMSQKIWRARYAIEGLMCTGMVAMNSAISSAKATATPKPIVADDYSFMTSGESNGIFDGLTSMIRKSGRSMYALVISLGVLGVVAGVGIAAVGFSIHKDPRKKAENKEHLGSVLMAGALLFAIPGILAIVAGIGAAVSE